MPNDNAVMFPVTGDHITLLKRMSMRTAVFVNDPDERAYWGIFTCCPDVSKKRPFGNSGDPAVSVLEELNVHPDESTGEYGPGWLDYARQLLIELPLAYEAVMAHGAVEPCEAPIDRYKAYFEYKARRSLEYWREAVTEAAALPDMDAGRLVDFAMNADTESPVRWAIAFRDMAGAAGPDNWIAQAYAVIERHLAAKWKSKEGGRPEMADDAVVTGLYYGRLVLNWPGWAKRPSGTEAGS